MLTASFSEIASDITRADADRSLECLLAADSAGPEPQQFDQFGRCDSEHSPEMAVCADQSNHWAYRLGVFASAAGIESTIQARRQIQSLSWPLDVHVLLRHVKGHHGHFAKLTLVQNVCECVTTNHQTFDLLQCKTDIRHAG